MTVFTRALLPLIVVLLLAPVLPAGAQDSRPRDEITALAKDVYLFRHQSHQALFLITSEGVLVTDPINQEAAAWLHAEIRKLTDQPVRYVIYSHHHNDHITGGRVFADTARFVSHAAARPRILKASDPDTPVPELTFTDRLSIVLGGTQVELIFTGKNHSDNNIVMLLPQHRILFAVDFIPVEAVAYRSLPDAYPDEWIESLKRVEQLDFDVLVPGHGRIGKKEHVRQFREYLEALRSAVRDRIREGASLEEAKQTIALPDYQHWYGYGDWFVENVEGMYRYLSQTRKD